MAEFRKSAVKIMQGKRTLFLTSLTVRDFMADGFYRVDHLDVQGNTGMQRLLNKARARSFGKDIIGANGHNEAFLPTSVFLATGGSIDYDENTKEMFFDSASHVGVCPLDVVDGQHRIEGLIYAATEDKNLLNFPVSAVIAPNMSEAEKMLQFVVVNTKQRPVNIGVAQHITARFTQMLELENLPYLPSWLEKQAGAGDDYKAIDIANKFNNDEKSPWQGRIRFANEAKDARHAINQATFVQSVKRLILTKNHPLNNFSDDKRFRILGNYWIAVANVFISPANGVGGSADFGFVIFTGNGLEFFHSILSPLMFQLAKTKVYTVDAIEACIRSAEDYLPADNADILSPEFWEKGGRGNAFNRGAMAQLANEFSDALKASHGDDIQL